MNSPFDFFMLVLGLLAGAVLVWLLISAHPLQGPEEPWRAPDDVEPAWLADELGRRGHPIDEATARALLELHRAYLEGRLVDEQADAAWAEVAPEPGADGNGPIEAGAEAVTGGGAEAVARAEAVAGRPRRAPHTDGAAAADVIEPRLPAGGD